MISGREMLRSQVEQVWQIDRREVIHNVYYLENGALILKPEYYDMQGWPDGEAELYTPYLYDCFNRGGWFFGLFEEEQIIAVAILDSKFIGPEKDQLQLKFLHVSREYRNLGLGRQLFELAKKKALAWGARQMYISSTPSENTVNFYIRRGAQVIDVPDPELLALEPEDIHLVYDLTAHGEDEDQP